MATDIYTIVLKSKGHHDEGITDATVYPGEAVRMAADGHYDPETLAADAAAGRGLIIAKEDALQGKTVADAYAATDVLFVYVPIPGDVIHALVKTGENIDVGDYLDVEGAGSGKFVEVSASATAEHKLPMSDARVWDDLSKKLPNAIANTTTAVPIPLTSAKIHDAMQTDLTDTANADDMGIITGTPGTDAPTLQGVDFGGTTSDEKCAFEVSLPADYVAGQPVTLRVKATMLTTVSDGTATVDAEAWETDGIGAVGADICATAAQSINSLTPANKDFTITPTGLAPGDRLIIRLSFAASDTGDAGVMIPEISDVSLRIDTATLADDMALITGTPGTDALTLQGVDFGGTTSDEKCAFEFVLPQQYRAGSAVTLRVKAGVLTTVSDTSLTVDASVWEDAGDGSVGADLCATAAQSINSLTPANKDFTITPTGLAPGDRLLVKLTFAGADTGNLGVMIPEIQNVALLIGNAAAGRLMSLEDSGGALAAATLLKCLVMSA